MNVAPPRQPFARLAALGLLFALFALLWLGLAAPFIERRADARRASENAESQLARFRAAVEGAASPAPTAPDSALLPFQPPALAAAALQSRVDKAIAAAGGVRETVQPRDAEPIDGAARVAISVNARFDIAALTRFLADVEFGAPYVFVERLEARRLGDARSAPETGPDELSVRMTLSALMRPADGEL